MVGHSKSPRRAKPSDVSPVPDADPSHGPLNEGRATLTRLRELGKIQCAPEEAASVMGVDLAALSTFLAGSEKARTAFEAGRACGLAALWRAQFKLAQTNGSMPIFLGKIYLVQSDRRESDRSDATDYAEVRQRVREKFAALIAETSAREAQGGD